jgi:hypothetical protein
MTEFVVRVVDGAEGVFSSIGMGNGTLAPVARGATGFLAGSLIAEAVRPEVSYNSDGTRRPWVLSTPDAQNPTYVPWWVWGVLGGMFCSTFI